MFSQLVHTLFTGGFYYSEVILVSEPTHTGTVLYKTDSFQERQLPVNSAGNCGLVVFGFGITRNDMTTSHSNKTKQVN